MLLFPLYFIYLLVYYLRGNATKYQAIRKERLLSHLPVILHMAAVAGSGPGWSQEPGTPYRFPWSSFHSLPKHISGKREQKRSSEALIYHADIFASSGSIHYAKNWPQNIFNFIVCMQEEKLDSSTLFLMLVIRCNGFNLTSSESVLASCILISQAGYFTFIIS